MVEIGQEDVVVTMLEVVVSELGLPSMDEVVELLASDVVSEVVVEPDLLPGFLPSRASQSAHISASESPGDSKEGLVPVKPEEAAP